VDYLVQDLDAAARRDVDIHLSTCAACRGELEAVEAAWVRFGILTDVEPGPQVRSRFYSTLEAFQTELESTRAARVQRTNLSGWLESWWPKRPALQVALTLLLFVTGLGAGRWLPEKPRDHGEVDQLRQELRDMRELVTLSLLQQQSASERLKGISWSYQMPRPDEQILTALLDTLNSDPNVNVRLAAVDALQKYTDQPSVRKSLLLSLLRQESPLLQIALIDLMVQLQEKQSIPALQKLTQEKGLHRAVKERAELGLKQLS
jgi:hypothetical protein